MCAGFVFLAIDELVEVHEHLDEWIHLWLGVRETALSDRLDDMIVALYAIAGMAALALARDEIRPFREALPATAGGLAAFGVMVVVDALTNRPDVIPNGRIFTALGIVEDAFKLVAECAFLTVGRQALAVARRLDLRPTIPRTGT